MDNLESRMLVNDMLMKRAMYGQGGAKKGARCARGQLYAGPSGKKRCHKYVKPRKVAAEKKVPAKRKCDKRFKPMRTANGRCRKYKKGSGEGAMYEFGEGEGEGAMYEFGEGSGLYGGRYCAQQGYNPRNCRIVCKKYAKGSVGRPRGFMPGIDAMPKNCKNTAKRQRVPRPKAKAAAKRNPWLLHMARVREANQGLSQPEIAQLACASYRNTKGAFGCSGKRK